MSQLITSSTKRLIKFLHSIKGIRNTETHLSRLFLLLNINFGTWLSEFQKSAMKCTRHRGCLVASLFSKHSPMVITVGGDCLLKQRWYFVKFQKSGIRECLKTEGRDFAAVTVNVADLW